VESARSYIQEGLGVFFAGRYYGRDARLALSGVKLHRHWLRLIFSAPPVIDPRHRIKRYLTSYLLNQRVFSAFPKLIIACMNIATTTKKLFGCIKASLLSRTIGAPYQLVNPRIHKRMMASAMGKRLEGKTVVITGASSGIGRSTALEFARTSPHNLKLILTARRIDSLHQLAEDIRKEVGDGVKVHSTKMDVSKPEEVKAFVPSLPAEFKEIDCLVNNA
jgi:hypothetical protein